MTLYKPILQPQYRMTANQLIELLQKLPPDIDVVIRGYEEGYNPISELKHRSLIPHPNQDKDYNGEFIDLKSQEGLKEFEAVELYGKNQKAIG